MSSHPLTPLPEQVADLSSVRREWTALAAQTSNVFLTWEWADAWRRHLGAGHRLAAGVVRRADGSASAVLPLYVELRRPVRVVRFIGSEPADELGPICAPEDVSASLTQLHRHAMAVLEPGGILLAEKISQSVGIAAALGGTTLRTTASPVVRFDGAGFEEYLATRSRNFRSQFRRAERRLMREH